MQPTDHRIMLLAALEDQLVREFRAYQSLIQVTREERTSLASGDVPNLVNLIDRKDHIIDELMSLEEVRIETVQTWGTVSGLRKERVTIADVVAEIPAGASSRFGRLREGILALVEELRDLNRGNQALAASALDRVDAVRTFLVSLEIGPQTYEAPNSGVIPAAQSTCGLEQWA